MAIVFVGAALARAQTGTELVDETFSGSSVADASFSVQGRTCLTGRPPGGIPAPGTANIPACPPGQSGPVPPRGVVPGYLQFTDASNNRAGSILYNRPIPSSAGIIADFAQWQYGGSGADGISFFLVDGGTLLTQTGGLGGSLGYAQRFTEPGVVHGYLGVGFDAFGNFYNDSENRGMGCPPQQKPPFLQFPSQLVPDVITLRGPGNGLTGYCWLSATATATMPPVSNLPRSLRAATLAAARRRTQITITPAPSPRVTVTMDFDDGLGPQTVLDIPAPPNPPSSYKFGWSGSTGGSTDVHLLRNVVVKTVVPLNRLNLVKQVNQNLLPNPLVVGSVVPYQFILTNTGLETLTSLTVSDPQVAGITCPSTSIDPAPAPTSTVVCTGSHSITQADLDAGQLVNTATATALDPALDPVTSNPSSVTIPLGTTARLALSKFIDTPAPYATGQSVTYRYDVTNTGTVTLTNPGVTDDLVATVSCDPPTTLVPGGGFNSSTTCRGTYVIQAADMDPTTGLLTNTATASAQRQPSGTVTSNPASLTIPVGVDIAVAKSVDLPTPILGDIVTFTVTATNLGPGDATGVTLSDPIVAGVTFASATTPPGTSYDPATGLWTIGSLVRGQTATLQLRVQVVSVDPYTNVASLAGLDQPDIDSGNDMDQVTITPIRDADVAMAKSVSDAAPAVGQQITFTVTATNLGPSPASGVVVTDPLPAGLTFVSAGPSQGSYVEAGGIWTVGTLAPSQSATLLLTALVAQPGAFTNTATKSAQNEPDPNPGNDSAMVSGTAALVADLSIVKSDGQTTVFAGSPVSYTIAVTNAGPSDIVGATVEDMFPPTLTNVTWSCNPALLRGSCGATMGMGTITTTIDLPAGHSILFLVNAVVDPSATGTLVNTATVTPPAGTTDPDPGNNTSTDTDVIEASADVVLTKTGPNPALPVARGQQVAFTLEVTNQGPSTATAVVVTDPPAAGLVFVSGDLACPTFPCSLGDLAPGATRTITATFSIPTDYVGPDVIVNTATATSPTPDPAPGNNTGSASVTLGMDIAELAVTKTDGLATVVAGTQTTYTITVTNQGPSAVVGAMVTDAVPLVLTDVTWQCSASAGASCGAASGTGSIATSVSLPVNATATFVLTGTVSPDADGQLVNTVSAQNPPGVADPSPSEATDTTQIVTSADLAITKTGPATVVPGNDLVYTIVVRNNGPSTALGAGVGDTTPPGLDFVSNAGDCTMAFPCVLGDMPPGSARTIVTTFAVPAGYQRANPIVNQATVASATPDPDIGNNTATEETPVNFNADIAVTKTISPATALVGGTVVFTVGATNLGPNAATGVTVTDVVPAGFALVDASATQGSYVSALGQWLVGALANGASAQLTLTAVVAVPGGLLNVATKTAANEPDPNTSNDSAAAILNGTTSADVGLRKTVDQPTPAVGDTVTFTVTATNFGPSGATGIVIADALPAGLTFQSATPSQGAYDPVGGTWAAGDLAAGASATLVLMARVDAGGPLVNFVRKTAQTELDPNPANDDASVTLNGAGTADLAVAKVLSDAGCPRWASR